MVLVRMAEPGDIPGIGEAARTSWEKAYRDIMAPEARAQMLNLFYSPESLRRALERANSPFLVACESDRVVGFGQFVLNDSDVAELSRLYVRPEGQGRGIGTAILNAGFSALPHNVRKVTVSVERDNAPARRFYEARGFQFARDEDMTVGSNLFRLAWYQQWLVWPVADPVSETRTKDGRRLVIRTIKPADAARVAAITAAVADEQIYIGLSKFTLTAAQYAAEIEGYNPEVRAVYCAEVDDVVVGVVDFTRPTSPKRQHTMSLGMFMLDGYRGLGIGSALMEAALNWGRERKLEKAFLSVYHTNDRAIGLYHKFGFTECGRYSRQYRATGIDLDEVFMEMFF